ncbi:MAG: hypothetical protein K6B41_01120 [Butyrivibrio sp.]|nr:hypothetical protein [Butyrivibrio sp.]
MNKLFKHLSLWLCVILTFGLLTGLNVSAADTESISVTESVLTISQGDYYRIGMSATNYVSYFIVGSTSSQTKVSVPTTENGGDVIVYVGEDETANTFHVYIYLDGTSIYADVEVNVQKTYSKTTAVDPTASTSLSVNTTTLTLTNEKKVGLFTKSDNTAVAQFSVSNSNGSLMQLTLGQVVIANGGYYITVDTPTAGTVNISETDKYALQSIGILGLYLNGTYVNWP